MPPGGSGLAAERFLGKNPETSKNVKAPEFHAIISSRVQNSMCGIKTYTNNSPYLDFLLQTRILDESLSQKLF